MKKRKVTLHKKYACRQCLRPVMPRIGLLCSGCYKKNLRARGGRAPS